MPGTAFLIRPLLMAAGLACFAAIVCAQSAGSTQTVWSGVYTKAQAAHGKELYSKNCASCHGDNLEGKVISDSSSPPSLKGERFVMNWVDTTVQDLHTRLRTTMPPAMPGSLKNEEYTDILAFLLEQNAYPAGNEQLPSDPERLKNIAITKDK